ncbi:MAG: CYTH domain-containing protein [Lentisphaeria bacterium]|jgi:adenylate cyclase|nr:CYTH domain-containing protein [Lentisphaeria bacterium]MDY0176944.1 CYTH domain-containing protein [Lentisphaeria bacterium]NLZ59799.1 CYTH domain-containing protein [Lentisphaerota bacterium]
MNIEIERKFLVDNWDWWQSGLAWLHLRQGYFERAPGYALRVRIQEQKALLSIKGEAEGLARLEYEYEIPLQEGEELLAGFCKDRIIEKTRYFIPQEDRLWEIDVYYGKNRGLITAEIELPEPDCPFRRPAWLGRELSADFRYSNENLARQAAPSFV